MAKYIECEALLKSDNWQNLKSDFDKARAHIIILGQPAADVVEVVRCGQCLFYEEVKYYHPTDKNPTKNVCRLFKRQMQPNDFCSYGERKCEDDKIHRQ